ncbi:hypothetical protein E3N88_10051 [Mikania micrantha]|uniref:J domain-containing protein n=1 Tax=Mikania micrantha TaxID=192012 RepID=A0A5N6P9K8_9ASTR|nr:hypothetical protein E3N88_10051 [Mikania micrantha]
MATTAGIINGCVSSSISAPSSSSSFGKLRGSRKKTTTTSTPANGGGGKRFRSCCISASSVASDPYKILRIRPGASESEVKTAFRQLALKTLSQSYSKILLNGMYWVQILHGTKKGSEKG